MHCLLPWKKMIDMKHDKKIQLPKNWGQHHTANKSYCNHSDVMHRLIVCGSGSGRQAVTATLPRFTANLPTASRKKKQAHAPLQDPALGNWLQDLRPTGNLWRQVKCSKIRDRFLVNNFVKNGRRAAILAPSRLSSSVASNGMLFVRMTLI